MQILGLFGMYFDAAVVFVTNSSLIFRFAMAILSLHLNFLKLQLFVGPNTSVIYCISRDSSMLMQIVRVCLLFCF